MLDIDNLINSAIENGWSLVIKYRKYSGEVSVRKISDIYCSDEFGDEYIDAYCHKREERRTFKINRILAAERANESSAFRQSSRPIVSDLGRRKVYSHSYLDSFRMADIDRHRQISADRHTAEQSYRPSQKTEGCYIATMAYGDYNHPQVIKLRKFRDDVLKSNIGFVDTCMVKLANRWLYEPFDKADVDEAISYFDRIYSSRLKEDLSIVQELLYSYERSYREFQSILRQAQSDIDRESPFVCEEYKNKYIRMIESMPYYLKYYNAD